MRPSEQMFRRARRARLAASVVVAAALCFWGGAAAMAHAQLVSATPGSGETLTQAPSELRLVFTERLVPQATAVDVLDEQGQLVVNGRGTVDPGDPYTFVVPLPELTNGGYTVQWRALSADDGHGSQGFYTFGVGTAPPGGQSEGSGGIHEGHDLTEAALETLGRALSQSGTLLSFGLLVVGLAVIRAVRRGLIPALTRAIGLMLLLTSLGAALVAFTAASSSDVDLVEYLMATQPGLLLASRAILGLVAGAAVLALAPRGFSLTVWPALIGSSAAVILLAASGHAAAYASATPLIVAIVHSSAAGVWLAGVAMIAWVGLHARAQGTTLATLRALVPRFSALALVSAGLFIFTGVYFAWLQTGVVIDTESSYGRLVLVKSALVVVALALGALTYLRLARPASRAVGRRARLELGIGLAVIAVTALLASGSPPAASRPIPLAHAFSSAPTPLDAELGLLPGRAGTNRFTATLPAPPAEPATLLLSVQRLDVDQGQTQLHMHPTDAARRQWTADITLAGDGAQWEAALVAHGPTGQELGRDRFTFTLSQAGLVAGRAEPVVSPPIVLAIVALAVAAICGAYVLAGGVLPHTDVRLGRLALLTGSAIAVPVAVLMVLQ